MREYTHPAPVTSLSEPLRDRAVAPQIQRPHKTIDEWSTANPLLNF
jgi:hypothetical protein